MVKKRYSMVMLLILLVGIFSISMASASDNLTDDNLMSNNIDNESLEMDVEDDDLYNLNDLIQESDSGDTIELDQDYKSYGGHIGIYHSIILDGKGHILDGDKKSSIIQVSSNDVVIKNIVFKNGFSDEDGGAIRWLGNNGILINCTFISNSATSDGGAVYMGGINNTIKDSTFKSNSAKFGGAVFVSSIPEAKITNCNFMKNKADNGGAIDWQGLNGSVFGCDFTENTAKFGGAVCWFGENGILTDCNFIGNSATSSGGGGAISWGSEKGTISKSSFRKNTAPYYGRNIECSDGIILSGLKYDEKATVKLSASGNYYKSSVLNIKVLYSDKTVIPNMGVNLKFSNGKTAFVRTNSKGVATYNIPYAPGTYSVKATLLDDDISADAVTLKNIKINKAQAKLTPTKLSTSYSSGKYFQTKVINTKTKKAMSGVKLKLKIFTGKKFKTVSANTNSKGIAKYSASKLSIGTHKVIVENGDTKYVSASSKTSSIKIVKATLKIYAPTVNNRYNMAGTFKVTVKNKESGAAMKNVKVLVNVYTGFQSKNYNLKTNANGQVSISTKSLSNANHKVIVSVKASANYKASKASSQISISNKKINTTLAVKVGNYYFNDFGDFNAADVEVILMDESGKYINKEVDYSCYYRINWGSDTVEYNGTIMSNEDTYLSIAPGSVYRNSAFGYILFEFKGDSIYNSSSCKINLLGR